MKIKERLGSITLTGVDPLTPQRRLQALMQNPRVEVAFLYAPQRIAEDHRYNEREWVESVVKKLKGRMALHICGERARWEFLTGSIDGLVNDVQRVQINGTIYQAQPVQQLLDKWGNKTIITQHTHKNGFLAEALKGDNHALLVDESGGKSVTPDEWRAPQTQKMLGFAGGLEAETLEEQMRKIAKVAKPGSWIDLESSLRGGAGLFGVDRAEEVVAEFERVGELEI